MQLGTALAFIALTGCSSASMRGTGRPAEEAGTGASSGGASGAAGTMGAADAGGPKTDARGIEVFDAGAADASDTDVTGVPDEGVTSDATAVDSSGPFTLTSSAFGEGDMIPQTYQCMHENVSPPLSWTAGPAGTRSYAVTMIHAIADMSLHWVLWDITVDARALPMNVAKVAEPPIPSGSKQVKTNIDGATWFGYVGPCPHGPSSNLFAVWAIDVATLPGVTTLSTPTQVDAVIRSHSLARATLTGATNK